MMTMALTTTTTGARNAAVTTSTAIPAKATTATLSPPPPPTMKSARKNFVPVLSSVKNFRPVLPPPQEEEEATESSFASTNLYRSATLDQLSMEDAQRLLDGSAFCIDDDLDEQQPLKRRRNRRIAAVIDLRNVDEIQKGKTKRSDGSKYFYSQLEKQERIGGAYINGNINNGNTKPRLYHIPILHNIDEFWDEAIQRMDVIERTKATLKTAFVGGALDVAAARNLEKGKLPLLYSIMLSIKSGQQMLKCALDICLQELTTVSKNDDGDIDCVNENIVIFHCEKGKDRTGMLSMLLQYAILSTSTTTASRDGTTIEEILINSYSQSGRLLGGVEDIGDDDLNGDNLNDDELVTTSSSSSSSSSSNSSSRRSSNSSDNDNVGNNNDEKTQKKSNSTTGLVDWSHFRGSPKNAIVETISWVKTTYGGSIDGYLDTIEFTTEQRQRLRDNYYSS